MKLKPFPNGLGYTFGNWDIWKPDGNRNFFQANYIPHGQVFASRSGRGTNYQEAILNAQPVNFIPGEDY